MSRQLTWPTMISLMFLQTLTTYLLLIWAGEVELTHPFTTFVYYNTVVMSTVGFGDISPSTQLGQLVVSFWQIPSGLILFASFIGKITQFFNNLARTNMNGFNDFSHYQAHILILGWNGASTAQIIELIVGDKKRQQRQILLATIDDIQHPFLENDGVSFVKLKSFSDAKELERIALSEAKQIIIDGKTDDETLSMALSVSTIINKEANVSAYFTDKNKARLLKTHCPQVECSVDSSNQMMVRSMQDPGSSQVNELLLSTLSGATLYCFQVPKGTKEVEFGALFDRFKHQYSMTLIGISHFKNGDDMVLNPDNSAMVREDDFLHYIANERMVPNEVNWVL